MCFAYSLHNVAEKNFYFNLAFTILEKGNKVFLKYILEISGHIGILVC